jgi:diguanylate cyclase (GGDEF)-like protein
MNRPRALTILPCVWFVLTVSAYAQSTGMINDREGHVAGDAALRAVGAAIRAELRESDAAARWGGDEFAILAPNISKPGAFALAERARARIAEQHGLRRLTGSLGVVVLDATTDLDGVDAAMLTRTADAALYEAKKHGGNRVTLRDVGSVVYPSEAFPASDAAATGGRASTSERVRHSTR